MASNVHVSPEDALQRILSRAKRTPSGCLIWSGAVQTAGYGQATVNGKPILSHRFVYSVTKGILKQRMQIRQSCGNRLCIEPDHLERVQPKTL